MLILSTKMATQMTTKMTTKMATKMATKMTPSNYVYNETLKFNISLLFHLIANYVDNHYEFITREMKVIIKKFPELKKLSPKNGNLFEEIVKIANSNSEEVRSLTDTIQSNQLAITADGYRKKKSASPRKKQSASPRRKQSASPRRKQSASPRRKRGGALDAAMTNAQASLISLIPVAGTALTVVYLMSGGTLPQQALTAVIMIIFMTMAYMYKEKTENRANDQKWDAARFDKQQQMDAATLALHNFTTAQEIKGRQHMDDQLMNTHLSMYTSQRVWGQLNGGGGGNASASFITHPPQGLGAPRGP
jgi:hypothetical protein